LDAAGNTDHAEVINMSTLRAMTQAYYAPSNFGHFGLALQAYAHFTSPIRRYADLVVHRALISAHGWGDDGLRPADIEQLDGTAQHISETERRSMVAERDTNDRYLAAFLSERVGEEFTGRISGIAKFGAFVRLDETGADGLIPVRSLGREFFHFDRDAGTLMGSDTGLTIGLGQRVTVRLSEAAPVTGGLAMELVSIEGETVRRGPSGARGKPPRRKHVKAKRKADKVKRKVERSRR
jgi:ribonuclease R